MILFFLHMDLAFVLSDTSHRWASNPSFLQGTGFVGAIAPRAENGTILESGVTITAFFLYFLTQLASNRIEFPVFIVLGCVQGEIAPYIKLLYWPIKTLKSSG